MPYLNIEIKARTRDAAAVRKYLIEQGASYKGLDTQTDTYFNAPTGRLKLREGNIENNLIYYERPDTPGPRHSQFNLVKIDDAAGLKEVLTRSMGIRVIVTKHREIYYIDNVKFHIDDVPGLGSFVEIEAGNILAPRSQEELRQQCEHYIRQLNILPGDMVNVSYSDMLFDC